ncbi:MAG: hypothetical protein ABEN55_02975 [Bradymonadaceae bacterium]
MEYTPLIGLVAVVVVGVFSQWLAWLSKLPAILLLLVAGFVIGPVTGFIQPDQLFGPLCSRPFRSPSR